MSCLQSLFTCVEEENSCLISCFFRCCGEIHLVPFSKLYLHLSNDGWPLVYPLTHPHLNQCAVLGWWYYWPPRVVCGVCPRNYNTNWLQHPPHIDSINLLRVYGHKDLSLDDAWPGHVTCPWIASSRRRVVIKIQWNRFKPPSQYIVFLRKSTTNARMGGRQAN